MKLMQKVKVVVLISVVLVAAVAAYGGSVPQIINYQGTLTNKDGTKANGSVNVMFNVYSTATGAGPLWTENWSSAATPSNPVIVTNGNFNVMLGALFPFPPTFFSDHSKTYLGIKVGTDSEMLPRQQFASVGYSFAAGNGIPKGGIIMWSGAVNQIPSGWVLCDGTNGTPDLRDRFVVGAGGGYSLGQIGGEAAHVLTIDEMPSHSHNVYISSGTSGPGTPLLTKSTTLTNTEATTPVGGGQPHNNLPPYFSLAFIMKL